MLLCKVNSSASCCDTGVVAYTRFQPLLQGSVGKTEPRELLSFVLEPALGCLPPVAPPALQLPVPGRRRMR